MEDFIRKHWNIWSNDHDYLRLGIHWDTTCPPLWFIGGRHLDKDSSPLVLISLEPLKTNHFPLQRDFAGKSLEQYVNWQLDFFETFPKRTGQELRPQRYWSSLHALVAGYGDEDARSEFTWSTYSSHFLELPMVPLHAGHHGNIRYVRAAMRSYLVERMCLVAKTWKDAVFVALGNDPTNLLTEGDTTTPRSDLELPSRERVARDCLGERFWVPIEIRRFRDSRLAGNSLFCRRAPFANGWSPKPGGRRQLGALVRQARDSFLR